MKKIKKYSLALLYLIFPIFVFGQGLVPECEARNCNFERLMDLVSNVIKFILFKLSLPLAAIMFAWAGILMITGGGEAASARTKAKNIFINTIIGLIIALMAWLIVHTILSWVGWDGSWIGF